MFKQPWVFREFLSAVLVGGLLTATWLLSRPAPQPIPAQPVVKKAERSPEVEAFIRRHYLHAIPFAPARSFGVAAVPTLLDMLGDRREDDFLANTVLVLGLVGEPAVSPVLVEVLEGRYEGEVPFWQYIGLLTVNVALGDLANHGDAAALSYLREGADPEFWRNRIKWSHRGVSREEIHDLLAKMAIYGLALSGADSALERLRELERAGIETFKQNVVEALELHGRIVREGLDVVFAAQGL